MDRLTLERTQPVQGKPVEVTVLWNDEEIGLLVFGFAGWLKFKKLLEKGLEMDARENYALQMRLNIRGKEAKATGEPYAQGESTIRISLKELISEDEEDVADLAAIRAVEAEAQAVAVDGAAEASEFPPTVIPDAEQTPELVQGVIRSLRREGAE